MTAGLNASFRFYRLLYLDDEVGGSYPTGTILYDNISGGLDEEPTDTASYQQGLETKKIFSAMFWAPQLLFHEQDEVEVVSPPNHEYLGQRFRVLSRTASNNHPSQKRNVWLAKLERSQLSHKNPYQ